jgi:hypothetical protein
VRFASVRKGGLESNMRHSVSKSKTASTTEKTGLVTIGAKKENEIQIKND